MKKNILKNIKRICSSVVAFAAVGLLSYVTAAVYYKEPAAVCAAGAPEIEDGVYFTGDYYGANILTESSLFSFTANPYLYRNTNNAPNLWFGASQGQFWSLAATCSDGTQKVYYGLKIEEKIAGYASLPDNGYYVLTGLPDYVNTSTAPNFAAGAYIGAYIMRGDDVTLDLSAPYFLGNVYQRSLSTEYYNQGGYYSTYNFIFSASDIKNAFSSIDTNYQSFNIVFVYNPPDNTSYMAGKNVGIKNLSLVYLASQDEVDTGYLNGYSDGYTAGYNTGLAASDYAGPFDTATIRAGILSPLYYPDYHVYADDIVLNNDAPFVVEMAGSTNNLMEGIAENYETDNPSAPALRNVNFGYEFTFAAGSFPTISYPVLGFRCEFGQTFTLEIVDGLNNIVDTLELNTADVDYSQVRYLDISGYTDCYVSKILFVAARGDLCYFRCDFSSSYSSGYKAGYGDGYSSGLDSYNTGYDAGYHDGYTRGAESGSYTLLGPIAAIAGIPATVLTSLFNFEIMGVNILGLVTGLITVAVIAWVVKKFI